MSTNSCVIIKLRREDIGKSIKFDKKKLPKGVKLESWVFKDSSTGKVWLDESANEKSKEVTLTGKYVAIYCHWDGYIENGVGEALKEKFSNYDEALNLLAGGWCSAIDNEIVKHYANRKREEWKDIKPVFGDSLTNILQKISQEYNYLLDENGWRCYKREYKKQMFLKY